MILITGAAGFIGYHLCKSLLAEGQSVVGVDSINAYYTQDLKYMRLNELQADPNFTFYQLDIAEHDALMHLPERDEITMVVHLAAQAGVRYSIDHPFEYATSNLVGHLSILEFCRHAAKAPRLIYASSSSVYGANTKVPFSESDAVDTPVSLYAATKRADELMSRTYAHLYGIHQTGLRFFTVYGPYGRPDMAYWTFSEKIMAGQRIPVFNYGKLKRDFTYIDDIIGGIRAIMHTTLDYGDVPHRVYNIGNNTPVELGTFITTIERALGLSADKQMLPMQPGDVHETYADIDALTRDYGFKPSTPLSEGIPAFIQWFRGYKQQQQDAEAA